MLHLPYNRSLAAGQVMTKTDGHTYRLLDGDLHCINGPAVEWADGVYGWYLNGRYYEFNHWLIVNTELSEEDKVMLKLQYG